MQKSARRTGAIVSSLLAMAVAGAVWSQQETQPATTATATGPGTATTSRPGINMQNTMAFRFVDARVDDILTEMSSRFGFIILKTQQIPTRVTIQVPEPVNAEQAVNWLNTLLTQIGMQAIESATGPGPEGRTTLRIVSLLEAKKANIPVYQGADHSKIANTDQLITQIIPLTNIDAIRTRNDLLPFISADADSAANPGSNTIIITDTSAKIRRLVEMIENLDNTKKISTVIQYRYLTNSTAAEAARLINAMFSPANLGLNTGGGGGGGGGGAAAAGRGAAGRGAAGGGGGTSNGLAAFNQRIYADSDPRTNTVILNGPPDQVEAALKVLDRLDAIQGDELSTSVFFIKNLKNAQAADIAPVLNAIFGNGGGAIGGGAAARGGLTGGGVTGLTGTTGFGATTGGTRGTTRGRSPSPTPSPSASLTPADANVFVGARGGAAAGGGAARGATGATGGARGATGGGNIRGASGNVGTAAAALAGMAYFVPNPNTNSLLVTTDKSYEDRVRSIIDELDRPVPQVLIKVLVADVSHANMDDLGFEFGAKDLRISTDIFGNTITFGPQIGTNFGLSQSSGSGGLKVSLVEGQVNATLQALARQAKLDILSRPYILVQDNQEAYMQIGQNVPYITNSQVTNNGQTINSVGYTSVGIILDVIPHINPEGLVTLDVSPQVSSLDTSTGVPIASNVIAPVFTREIAQTRVAIKNGETIVIGGLMQDQKVQAVDKVPILGDIPYFGMFFKHTIDTKAKHELLIFLTPHVAMAPDFLQKMTEDEEQTLKLAPTAIQPGTWEQQLKGMKAGATTTQPATEIRIEGRNLAPGGR